MKWFETVLDENVQNRPFLWIKIVQYLIWKLWSVLFAARSSRAWQQSYYVPLPSQKLAFYMKKVAYVLLPPWLGSLWTIWYTWMQLVSHCQFYWIYFRFISECSSANFDISGIRKCIKLRNFGPISKQNNLK